MSAPFKAYFGRSIDILRRRAVVALNADPNPTPGALSIFSFQNPPITPVSSFATGSDIDIGGLSMCALTSVPGFVEGADKQPEQSHLAFYGNLSLRVPPEYAGRIRTGYAAFRNKSRPSMFGEDTWDLDLFSHLKVELAYRGWEQWRGRWVCNIQTEGPVRSDLFQHRLDLPSEYTTPNTAPLNPATATGLNFHTLYLPLSSFVLTNSGRTSETQIEMLRGKIRTIGFALLGGGRGNEAPSEAQIAAAQKGVLAASGGWGTPSANEEVDPEVAELVASDLGSGYKPDGRPASASGYHRVGDAPAAGSATSEVDPLATAGEGYYELCIRSVEAVRYDPELE